MTSNYHELQVSEVQNLVTRAIARMANFQTASASGFHLNKSMNWLYVLSGNKLNY
jgi:hypothetical protein